MKNIYEGLETGIFTYGDFERFMREQKAEFIKGRFSAGATAPYQIWHLKDATVLYTCTDSMRSSYARVSATGTKEAIGEVEKIILSQPVQK